MTGRQWEKSLVARAGLAGLLCGWLSVALLAGGCAAAGAKSEGSSGLPQKAPETAAYAPAPPAPPAPREVSVSRMSLAGEENSVRLRLEGDGSFDYALSGPGSGKEVFLDLRGVRFEGLSGVTEVEDGVISSISFGPNGRVAVKLMREAEVEARKTQNGVDLVVSPLAAASPEAKAAPASAKEHKTSAAATIDGGSMKVDTGSETKGVSSFLLSDGTRLVVDLDGAALSGEFVEEYSTGPIARIVMRGAQGSVRAVIEARDAGVFSSYGVAKVPSGFEVTFNAEGYTGTVSAAAAHEAPAAPAKAAPAPAPAKAEAKPAPAAMPKGLPEVVDFGFHQDAEKSYVDIATSKPVEHEVVEAAPLRVVVDLKKTSLTSKFQRALDTSAFNGPVRIVAAYQRGADTRVIIDLKSPAPFAVEKKESAFAIAFEGGSSQPAAGGAAPERIVLVRDESSGASQEMAAPSGSGTQVVIEGKGPKKSTASNRISMDFVDADIRNILRIIGEVAGINIVTGSEVTGNVTIRLIDVPWDKALDVILKAKGLDKEVDDNIMRIVGADKIAAEKAARQAAVEAAQKLELTSTPLASEIFPVNYAGAKEVLDKVKTVLSDRGSAIVDDRTNTILVRDLPASIEAARELVARLDTPTPQVLIEARIVEVESTYSEDLGIQWGGEFAADAAHGNSTGFAFPNSIGVKGDTGASNYIVNLPTSVGTAGAAGGAFSLNMGHINDILSLDLRIAALETSGKGRVVSSPRVTTLDNKTAEISQGFSLPFNVTSGEEIEVETIDYLLQLRVTPHVTSDASIMLKMEIKKDDVSTLTASDGTPGKQTRTANTEVLVKDGQTAVIGGIITDSTKESESGIPWFHRLPFIGWLFKSKTGKIQKTELIIFITPKIVQLEQTASM